MSRGTPADELICVTSADHPAKFNCELKCSGCRPRVKDEHFRSACSGGGCRIFHRWVPNGEQNSPHGGRAVDFSLLGPRFNIQSSLKICGPRSRPSTVRHTLLGD